MLRSRPNVVLMKAGVLLGGLLLAYWASSLASPVVLAVAQQKQDVDEIPFDGARAYGYLKQLCAIGPRLSGSEGMLKQQELIAEHFEKLGAKVTYQRFRARHPLDGSLVPMANMIIEWHPERKNRILLGAHYDTRPLPDRDPDPIKRREGKFIGANDGASGVALLMELGNEMQTLNTEFGIDFVLFDGEELVYDAQRDPYFLGSEWFSRHYVQDPPEHTYDLGVVVDMIADKNLLIFQERNSTSWAETQPLVTDIWKTAARLGVKEFVARRKHTINDDHIKLRNVAKIPCCVIIDFDYPAWHTAQDIPSQCSPKSLAKVGWVLSEWLQSVKSN